MDPTEEFMDEAYIIIIIAKGLPNNSELLVPTRHVRGVTGQKVKIGVGRFCRSFLWSFEVH